MSYIEKTLYWFLKEKIFGGLKKLKQKEFFPFALIVITITTLNTTLAILYQLDIIVSLSLLQNMLILQLFISLGLVASGMLIGRMKSISLSLIFGFLIIFFRSYFKEEYQSLFII